MLGASKAGKYQAGRALAVALRGAIARQKGKDGADLEILEVGSKKEIWSKAKGSSEGKHCLHQPFDSRAVAEVAWGSRDAHVQSTATR